MDIEKELGKIPKIRREKPSENTSKIPLLTPGQKRILAQANIQRAIAMFDLDTSAHSSLHAVDALKISHKIDTLFAELSGSPPPPPIDLSKYAPLSPSDQKKLEIRNQQKKLTSLPHGFTLDSKGNTTFDMQWKQKGIYPTELPKDHPDWTPF